MPKPPLEEVLGISVTVESEFYLRRRRPTIIRIVIVIPHCGTWKRGLSVTLLRIA